MNSIVLAIIIYNIIIFIIISAKSQSNTTAWISVVLSSVPTQCSTSFPPFFNFWSSSSLNVVIDIDLTRCGGLIPRLRGRREEGEGEGQIVLLV